MERMESFVSLVNSDDSGSSDGDGLSRQGSTFRWGKFVVMAAAVVVGDLGLDSPFLNLGTPSFFWHPPPHPISSPVNDLGCSLVASTSGLDIVHEEGASGAGSTKGAKRPFVRPPMLKTKSLNMMDRSGKAVDRKRVPRPPGGSLGPPGALTPGAGTNLLPFHSLTFLRSAPRFCGGFFGPFTLPDYVTPPPPSLLQIESGHRHEAASCYAPSHRLGCRRRAAALHRRHRRTARCLALAAA